MSVPFRKRLQRYLGENVETLFSIPVFKIALNRATTRSIFACAASDETTPFEVGANAITFMAPIDFSIVDISASLSSTQLTGDDVTADVNVNGTSILSTKITFDNGVVSTIANPIKPVLSKTKVIAGDKITVDIDQVGDGTATGLKVYLVVEL